MTKNHLIDELILRYRDLVEARYQFDNLEEAFILDESITKELVDKVRAYFLNYVYPTPAQRKVLNQAFEDLDKHIKNPSHLLKLLGDAPGIVLKFGWQFPKAIKTGFHVLKSFKSASKFESELLQIAEEMQLVVPISSETFEEIISKLSKDELQEFINDFEFLLSSLMDSDLLKKTTDILKTLVLQMKKTPNFYSQEEIAAMNIGIDILENGYHLFDNMSNAEKREMIELIIKAESKFLEEIVSNYHSS